MCKTSVTLSFLTVSVHFEVVFIVNEHTKIVNIRQLGTNSNHFVHFNISAISATFPSFIRQAIFHGEHFLSSTRLINPFSIKESKSPNAIQYVILSFVVQYKK